VPVLTAFENVELPLLLTAMGRRERREKVEEAMERVNLTDRMENYPRQLSGGQEQRVAVARAIVSNPELLVADEPTGALDSKTGAEVLDLFRELHQQGNTLLLVTHDPSIAALAERRVEIRDGLIAAAEGVA